MEAALICDGPRTLFGRYGGSLGAIRPDDLAAIPIRAVLARHPGMVQCGNGARIYVENFGLRHGPAEAMERLRFETGDESYRWLTRHRVIATGVRRPDRVELAIHQVL